MMWENWVLDATGNDGTSPFVFYPIEDDATIIFGMNFLGDRPPGNVVAVIHAEGQEAVMNWCEKHELVLKEIMEE